MAILVLNCGSSSIKYQLYDWAKKEVLLTGGVERIGQAVSVIEQRVKDVEFKKDFSAPTHKEALELVLKMIVDKDYGAISNLKEIDVVGHRVVHGGEEFKCSSLVDDKTIEKLKKLTPLAPLHNPANIQGIQIAQMLLKGVPQAIVMDTAWHQTMSKEAYLYAVPMQWYEKYSVRRYGFHGTSHLYCAKRAAVLLGKSNKDTNAIICHIGNGASLCAVKNGICIDTTMGMTPLEGLIMGTRSGAIDPAIVTYMQTVANMTPAEVDNALNKKSGLLGLCGKSDRRDVESDMNNGVENARIAFNMEARMMKKAIGSYMALLGRVDAIVFTAGVGEFGNTMRNMALEGLEEFGVQVDSKKNDLARSRSAEFDISSKNSKIKVFVIPTDEELVITEDAHALANGTYKDHTQFTYSFESPNYCNKARLAKLSEEIAKKPDMASAIAKNSWKC